MIRTRFLLSTLALVAAGGAAWVYRDKITDAINGTIAANPTGDTPAPAAAPAPIIATETPPTVTETPTRVADVALPDLHAARPWLPELPAKITPEITAAMTAFNRTFGVGETRPANKGLKPGAADAALEKFSKLGLSRGTHDEIRAARRIVFRGEFGLNKNDPKDAVDFLSVFMPAVHDLRAAYAACKSGSEDETKLADALRLCLAYVATTDWNSTQPKPFWVGNGYAFRDRAPGREMLSLAHLLPDADSRAKLAEVIWWTHDGSDMLLEKPGVSTDSALNTLPQAFAGVAAIPDGPLKWQRILTLRRMMDLSVVGNDYNLVTPDGGVIHHGGYHISYAGYSFGAVSGLFAKLSACGVRSSHSPEIARRFRLAGEQWAWATCPGTIAPNLQMRVTLPSASEKREKSGGAHFAMAAAPTVASESGVPSSDDAALASLVLFKNPGSASAELRTAWQKNGYAAKTLSGNSALPCAGASIHGRDGWKVIVRGQNKFLRGGEGMPYGSWGQANTYGGRFCHGSLFIADTGDQPNIPDSGWVLEGFDYSRVPGTTGPVLDWPSMVGGYFGTGAALGGGCSLDGQGMWAFAEGGVLKSCFMIDDRITFVTSGAKAAKTGRTMTTVFQDAEPSALPMSVDGLPIGAEGEKRLSGKSSHRILDARSRGYFFHAGGDDLTLRRGVQKWSYSPAKGFNARTARPSAEQLKQFVETRMRYSTAGYEHDAVAKTDAFTLLMKTDARRLDAFAAGMNSAERPVVFKTSDTVHTFRDRATGFAGVAMFAGGEIPEALRPGETIAVSRMGTLLESLRDKTLRLAVASTDIGDTKPFVVRLRGVWKADALPAGATLETRDGETLLTIPFIDQTTRIASLKRE